jgi:hypothetical protein
MSADEAGQPPPTLEELEALVAQKEQEAEAITQTLGEMWQQRQQGKLPREQYPDYMYYEDQLRVTLKDMERLGPQLRYARAVDAMTTARTHHDHYCALVAEQGLRVCDAWKTFLEACQALATLIDEQRSPLEVLTRADGQPMFELDSGATTLKNMVTYFPGQPGLLVQSVIPYLRDQITVGQARAILEHVKGRAPFSETNVQRYLAEYRVKDPESAFSMEE